MRMPNDAGAAAMPRSLDQIGSSWLGGQPGHSVSADEFLIQTRSVLEMNEEERLTTRTRWMNDLFRMAWEHIPFYRRLWERHGLPARLPTELEAWPTWSVTDLRDELSRNPPFGELYLPEALDDIAFIHSSTGTTGTPRLLPLCVSDMPNLNLIYRRFYALMGLTSSDVCVMTGSYGVPAGSWSLTRAIRSVGATVLPVSSGKVTPPLKVLELIDATRATAICGTASYVLHIARKAQEDGRDLRTSSVRLILLSGETATKEVRQELTELWGATTRCYYANTDLGWVAVECNASGEAFGEFGMHIFDDLSHIEILDNEHQPCAHGTPGEVVITSCVRPSTPRIRFRTGDRAAIDTRACPCGAQSLRLLPITGRVDDAIRYHGVTIWPTAIESVIHQTFAATAEFYVEVRSGSGERKDLVVVVESDHDADVHEALSENLRRAFSVRVEVEPVPVGSLTSTTKVDGGLKVQRVGR